MGNSQSEPQNDDLFKQFIRQQWKRLKDLGHFQLWQNTKTNELCQAYKLDYIPQAQDMQHYRFRHYNADSFVQIRYVDVEKSQSLCYHGESYVLTEFVPVKLAEMNGITTNEGFAILKAAWRAFHTMEAFHGPFVPSQELIGVNLSGKPKIWLNKNHSKNKADKVIQAEIWQKHMGEVSENVKRILEMVEEKLKDKQFPHEFREFFYDNVLNFSQAAEFVEQYCQQQRITIPQSIEYMKYLTDPFVMQIVTQYNTKKREAFNDRVNTLESYENSKVFMLDKEKEQSPKILRRNQSHQNFTYHENNQRFFSPEYFRPQVQRVNYVPFAPQGYVQNVQRVNNAMIVIPASGISQRVYHHQKSNSGLVAIEQTQGGLRSTVSVIRQPLPQPQTMQPGKIVDFRNMVTPAHVSNNVSFVPPSKIMAFQLPNRTQMVEGKEGKEHKVEGGLQYKAESIHEKIKEFENDDNEDFVHQNHSQLQRQQQNQFLKGYINQASHHQPQSQPQQPLQSQPDLQHIQAEHNHQHLTESAHLPEQAQQYDHADISPIKQPAKRSHEEFDQHYAMFSKYARMGHEQQAEKDVEPERGFVPRNMRLDQSGELDDGENYDQQPQENQYNVYQHHNRNQQYQYEYKIAQSQQEQPQFEYHSSHQQPSEHQQHQSSLVPNQSSQPSELQSSQRMNPNSSKNTSLLRPQRQSSGTLVIHESRENIYQGVNSDEKSAKILIANIRQESQESQGEDEQMRREEYDQEESRNGYDDNVLGSEETDQRHYRVENQGYQGQNLEEYQEEYQGENQGENQRNQMHLGDTRQDYHQEYQQSQSQDQRQSQQNYHQFQQAQQQNQYYQAHHQQYQQQQYDEVHQQQDQRPVSRQQHRPSSSRNQYQNLHFRNQSDELYQYTPVESIYKKESAQQQNPYGSFSRPSGVEDLVKLERHEDIQEYIRNKYQGLIGGPQTVQMTLGREETAYRQRSSKTHDNRAMTFAKPRDSEKREDHIFREVQSKQVATRQYNDDNFDPHDSKKCEVQRIQSVYQPIENYLVHEPKVQKRTSSAQQSNADGNDFLDVGNLEKSLDQKYNQAVEQERLPSPKHSNMYNIKGSQTMSEEDGMNVAALEQRLQKFEERQSIEREKSQRKLQPYQEEESQRHNNELNFNQLDNIVELMDKKIQESQKKQKTQIRQQQSVTQFRQMDSVNEVVDPLGSVQLQTSINNLKDMNNKQISLKDIPILYKDQVSNASNSIPSSKRDYYKKFGVDSQDFATGRGENSVVYTTSMGKKDSYSSNRRSNKQQQKYDTLAPVIEIDKKYETYSSKNLSSYDYKLSSMVPNGYDTANEYRRKSSRRSTKNNDDVKRLAEQISSKYDKYMNGKTNVGYQNEIKPFAKKKYYDRHETNNYEPRPYDSKLQNSKPISKGSQVSNMQRKRSSYLNTITELNGEYNASPYKQQKPTKIALKVNDYLPSNQQNYLKLSNQSSKRSSRQNIQVPPESKGNKSSRVSYDQLRDLLWK